MKALIISRTRAMFWSTVLVGIVAGASSLQAQQYLATIAGTVTDPSGATVAGATVSAENQTTHFTSLTTTNEAGAYSIPFVNPGSYSISVTAHGFALETAKGIEVVAGDHKQVDFSLKVGPQSETLTVTAAVPLVDLSSATIQTTLETHEVEDLPNVGRNPFVLSDLAAGVINTGSGGYMEGKASTFTNPFSGTAVQETTNGTTGHNRLTLDGSPDDPAERFSGASYTGFVPSPEAVQEVNVQTGLYDAQYGHGNGVVTNTVLRSGTNQYHGAFYESFRNTYMNANTFERVPTQSTTTPRSNDQWEQPGMVITGPLSIPKVYNAKDKTFFTLAGEYLQLHQTLPYSTLVPTISGGLTGNGMIGGDFSSLCSTFNSSGLCTSGVQIYDPAASIDGNGNRTIPAAGSTYSYFPYNEIPSGRWNATGQALMKYYPAPNSTFSPTINYISSQTSVPNQYYSVVTRFDESINPNNKFSAKWFKAVLHQYEPLEGFPKGIGPATSNNGSGDGYTVYRNNMGGGLDYVSVLPRDYVLDARIGVIYHPFGLVYPGSTFNLSGIGMTGTGLPYPSFPGVWNTVDSYGGLAAGSAGQISEDTLSSTELLVSKQVQRHSLKAGFDGNLSRYNVQNPMSGIGTFQFSGQFTQLNESSASSTSGWPIADLLLGYPVSGSYGNNIAFALQQKYAAVYVQDDWRVNDKLTVNVGVRWDYESPYTERHNRLNTGFCATCTNPLQSSVPSLVLNGGLDFASNSNRFSWKQNFNNYQPRFGVAYQLMPKIVLRGGIGLTYFDTLESEGSLASGYSQSTSYVSTVNGYNPSNSLTQPWPSGVQLPTGSSLGLSTLLGQSVTYPDPDHTQPRMLPWSVSLQTQLPANVIFQVAYVGNKVERLEVNKTVDALPAADMQTTSVGTQAFQNSLTLSSNFVTNPMAGFLPGSSLNNAKIAPYLLEVPYPEFNNVTDNYLSVGKVYYNSVQATVRKQISHGFDLQGNFSFAHVSDDNYFLNPQSTSLHKFEDNQPNILLNVFGTYHFPEFRGKSMLVREPLGGWALHGVLRAYNGSLINNPGAVGSGGGTGGSQYGTSQTYVQLQNPKMSHNTYGQFFNNCYINQAGTVVGPSTCQSNPAFQQTWQFTLNTLTPYMDVRQRVHPLYDFSLFKQFPIHESDNFEIRGEFFNAFNTPNFGSPGTTPTSSSSYGIVTMTQQNDPRLIQLTARFNF